MIEDRAPHHHGIALNTQAADDMDIDVKPLKSAAKGKAKHAAQPFNIGTYSSVAKSSLADLALSEEEEEKPKPVRGRGRASVAATKAKAAPRGKGKGAAKGRASIKQEIDAMSEESEMKPTDDFAFDSEDEERQLKAAIRQSALNGAMDKFGSGTTTEAASRESSVPTKGKRRGAASSLSTPSTGRKARAVVLKSAPSEFSFATEPLVMTLS